MVQKLRLAALLLLLGMLTPQSSFAQDAGNSSEVRIKENSTSLFPRNVYDLQFFNDPRTSESEFKMRFIARGVVAGCAYMEKGRPPFEERERYKDVKDGYLKTFQSSVLKIDLIDTNVRLDEKNPRYSAHDCNTKHNISYIDVPINRDELIDSGIKKFMIYNANYGDFGEHEIDVNKDRFILKAKSPAGEYWATLWFFPKNSVTLIAPEAKNGNNVKDLIREFGISHGLTPIEDVLEGYTQPRTAKNYVIFNDPKGRFVNQLSEEQKRVLIGTISPTRTIYGAAGPGQEPYTVNLFAALPVQKPDPY